MPPSTPWGSSPELLALDLALRQMEDARAALHSVVQQSAGLIAETDWCSSAMRAFQRRRDEWVAGVRDRIGACDDIASELQRLRVAAMVCVVGG